MITPDRSSERHSIIFFRTNLMAGLLTPLARRLTTDHGVDSILVTEDLANLPSTKRYDFDVSAFAELVDLNDVFSGVAGSRTGWQTDLQQRMDDIDRRLGISIVDLIRSDRHFGRDFIFANWFYKSRLASRFSFDQRLEIVTRMVERFEQLLQQHAPLAVVAYPGTIITNALVSTAESMGIPMVSLAAPRRGRKFYWQIDRFGRPKGFEKAYEKELLQSSSHHVDLDSIADRLADSDPERIRLLRKKIAATSSVTALMKRLAVQLRKHLPGYIRGRAPRYGEYTLSSRMWYELIAWRWRRDALKMDSPLPRLDRDLPFVFFPLTMEPEASLQVEAQSADNQLAIIDWLAKTLPSGWRLIVKEHPAQGIPRSKGFRDQLSQYPNVIQAAHLEPAEPYIRSARAIATINGTIGFQAASIGKPVITVHENYFINPLPHVQFVNSYATVRAALRKVRDNNLPPLQQRIQAFDAMSRALNETEFEVNDKTLLSGHPSSTIAGSDDFVHLYDALRDAIGLNGIDDTTSSDAKKSLTEHKKQPAPDR
jgi:hypothetical protein